METTSDYNDNRQKIIDAMNDGRRSRGDLPLTSRQEHLVREFTDDEGNIAVEDRDLLRNLLRSNSV